MYANIKNNNILGNFEEIRCNIIQHPVSRHMWKCVRKVVTVLVLVYDFGFNTFEIFSIFLTVNVPE